LDRFNFSSQIAVASHQAVSLAAIRPTTTFSERHAGPGGRFADAANKKAARLVFKRNFIRNPNQIIPPFQAIIK
jgi:hypothetical protein